MTYSKALEYEYSYSYRRRAYFCCSLIGSIIIALLSTVTLLKPILLSRSLVFYIIYLYNNYVNLNGMTVFHPTSFVVNKYVTVVLLFISAAFQMFSWSEYFIGIIAGYLFTALKYVGIVGIILNYLG